jgi:hypothetical protein
MKKFRYSILAAAAVALTVVTASSALVAKPFLITGKYSGQASTKVDGNTATIAATGVGKATILGAGKIIGNGTGDSSQQPCVPFGGTGKIIGTARTTITYKLLSPSGQGCGDEGGHIFSVKGTLVVVKATGKLAKAKGTLRFTGVYSRDDGTFSIKLTGTLKK